MKNPYLLWEAESVDNLLTLIGMIEAGASRKGSPAVLRGRILFTWIHALLVAGEKNSASNGIERFTLYPSGKSDKVILALGLTKAEVSLSNFDGKVTTKLTNCSKRHPEFEDVLIAGETADSIRDQAQNFVFVLVNTMLQSE